MAISAELTKQIAQTITRRVVLEAKRQGDKTICCLRDAGTFLLSGILGAHIRPGDEIAFPLGIDPSGARTEILIRRDSPSHRHGELYQAAISYTAQPKADKRGQVYVRAALSKGHLGFSSIQIPCDVLRDYFYVAKRGVPWEQQTSLYDVLRTTPTASNAELRLAFKLRQLELLAACASKHDKGTAERAFNILAIPELRTCYDLLLKDPSAPALFPYGGFGSVLVAGNRSPDDQTFFATQILSFQPDRREHRFRAPLRYFDFHNDRAIYRDTHRKLEFTVDQSAMPIPWDATWNQWRHLIGAEVEVQGTFITTGDYRNKRGVWPWTKWETALPSRIEVKLPADIAEQIETARTSYHRFGKFSDALAKIRALVQREPMERETLRSLCWDLGIPGDFDIAQINWQPAYDAIFLRELSERARRLYLYRSEYILELERYVAVETPQPGHATYLFSRPRTMEAFLALYVTCTKAQIRRNSSNSAEKLGFLGRIAHGTNPRTWLKELRSRLGEPMNSEADGP
jgi:hypothetical protein